MKITKISYYKAFTLVELIIVMAIFATLLTLGIGALVGLRESSKLNKDVSDFSSEARTLVSKARNNVYTKEEIALLGQNRSCSQIVSQDFVPDAVGYYFNATTMNIQYVKCVSNNISTQGNYCCTIVNDVSSSFKKNDKNIEYIADCSGVIFEYSTGKIYRFNPTGEAGVQLSSGSSVTVKAVNQKCSVTVDNTFINYSKEVVFDGGDGSIIVK